MIFQYFKKLKDKINRFSHIISNWTNHEKHTVENEVLFQEKFILLIKVD